MGCDLMRMRVKWDERIEVPIMGATSPLEARSSAQRDGWPSDVVIEEAKAGSGHSYVIVAVWEANNYVSIEALAAYVDGGGDAAAEVPDAPAPVDVPGLLGAGLLTVYSPDSSYIYSRIGIADGKMTALCAALGAAHRKREIDELRKTADLHAAARAAYATKKSLKPYLA